MRTPLVFLPVALAALVVACTDPIPTDTLGDPSSNVPAAAGVIRGSVLYQGPRPCSANGHIIGAAVVLLFDQNNPPPPTGLANTAVNFVSVPGDVLFANEPRYTGKETYCPAQHGFEDTITASAPFAVSPLDPAAYLIEAFYDTTGDFLPTFKFRNLPEQGDVGGGDIDTADALKPINAGNPNYMPVFLPVGVGVPQAVPAGSPPGAVPLYTMPAQGYIADNVQVTIGEVLTSTRPYAYVQGVLNTPDVMGGFVPQPIVQSSDAAHVVGSNAGIPGSVDISNPNYAPILTFPQDILTFAPPQTATHNLTYALAMSDLFEFGGPCSSDQCKSLTGGKPVSGFPHIRLMFGTSVATDPTSSVSPFDFQIKPFSQGGGFNVWIDQYLGVFGGTQQWIPRQVPEGALFPNFWPAVILNKLEDDPGHTQDPASLKAQGSATAPVVLIQGFTLPGSTMASGATNSDAFYNTILSYSGSCLDFSSGQLDGQECGTAYLQKGTDHPIVTRQDHIASALRPAVICFDSLFDANVADKRGVVVTPTLRNDTSDFDLNGNPAPQANWPIVPVDLVGDQKTGTCDGSQPKPNPGCSCDSAGCHDLSRQQASNLVKPPPGWTPGQVPAIAGCLPTGRYAINVVYPDGQAWTVPNEAGACTGTATGEGDTNWNASPISCTLQPRPVIRSQGPRAVVEITASTSGYCKDHPVPQQCVTH